MVGGVLFSVLFAVQQAQLRPTLRPVSYFPLQRGTTWVYQVSGVPGGERVVSAKPGVVPVSTAAAAVLLEGYFPGPARLVRSAGGTVEEIGPTGEAFLWYRLGAPEGISWTLRLAPQPQERPLPCTDGARLTLASRHETVTVPAGRFENVVLVRWETPCRDAGVVAEWFAPGVGLVQREEASFAGGVLWQLKEMRRDELDGLPRYGGALALSRRQYVLNLMPPVDPQQLPSLEGTLALWLFDPTPDVQWGVPLCLEVTGEIEDESQQTLKSFAIRDPGCHIMAPLAWARYRLIPFQQPLLLGDTPLPQGAYTLKVTVSTPGWNTSFSLPFTVSHVY
jgi:hypothetical protein|uniref:Intracellular proteinase inhibitor BsuPI domain-containing protein n=1 Tax=Thermoanaerobaculum aquaticum TaxID=1312852 RepID=A0A7C2SPL5_9BACT